MVDLSAGAGDCTLQLLRGGASHVHCWVPRDVDALTLHHNLEANRLLARCTVHRSLSALTTLCAAAADRVRVALTLPDPAAAAADAASTALRPLQVRTRLASHSAGNRDISMRMPIDHAACCMIFELLAHTQEWCGEGLQAALTCLARVGGTLHLEVLCPPHVAVDSPAGAISAAVASAAAHHPGRRAWHVACRSHALQMTLRDDEATSDSSPSTAQPPHAASVRVYTAEVSCLPAAPPAAAAAAAAREPLPTVAGTPGDPSDVGEVPLLTSDTWDVLDDWLETRNTPAVLTAAPLGVTPAPSSTRT